MNLRQNHRNLQRHNLPEFLTGSLASIKVALVKRLVYDVITAFLTHLLVKLELNDVTHKIP